jgi:glutaconate CoA-transferase subunit B
MPITDYTIDELMVVCLARAISDGDMVFHGVASPLPMTALYTAKQTHAPHMVYLAGVGGGIDPTPPFLPESTNDIWMQWGSIGILTIDRVFDYFARIEVPVMFFSGGQIDKYGNINNTGIWEKPFEKFRTKFPGGAGACNLSSLTPKIVAWTTRHSVITHKKTGRKLYTLVDKVDFITSVGYLSGPGEREKVGCAPNTGPYKVVTELAVFGFDEQTKIMKLESVHPDVTVEDVIENTEFKPVIPKHVPTTPPPTKEEIRLIRTKIDPYGIRRLEFRSGDELLAIKGPGAKECDKRRFKF